MIKINDEVIELKYFPDSTFATKYNITDELLPSGNVNIKWLYEEDSELVMIIFLVKHLRNKGIKDIDLYMPYIPNARLDRVKAPEDIFTLKYFAEVINDLEFRSVKVLDPHSYVSEALIDRIIIETPDALIAKALEDITNQNNNSNIVLFYPDEGAMKRYSGRFDNPFAFGIKKRDWKTGNILGLDVAGEVDLIKDRDILIVDDICSRGGTFYHSAKKLKDLGAGKVYLYISHCENTILRGDVLDSGLIERVYTTNSIFRESNEKIKVTEL